MFTASCYAVKTCTKSWLIDNGFTNHTCSDEGMFKKLDKSYTFKVIGNGERLEVKYKGVVVVEISSGIKLISDVLYVPNIS